MIVKGKICIWLVDILSRESLTFKELQERWINSAANIDKKGLEKRSFERYKQAVAELFNVDVLCDAHDGYKYHLDDDFDDGTRKYKDWLLSSFHLTNLSSFADYNKKVLLDMAPKNTDYLSPILESVTNKHSIKFAYHSFMKKRGHNLEMIPSFVKYFKQRWYVIGEEVNGNFVMTCALERMKELTICDGKKVISDKNKDILSPENYFRDCYGVIRENKEPVKIVIRAYEPQNLYIKSTPIHECQKEIAHGKKYTDFEYFLRPTYDLQQELFWHMNLVEVLEPESLRKDMKNMLKVCFDKYNK